MEIDILLNTSNAEVARQTLVGCMTVICPRVAVQIARSKIEFDYAEFNDGSHWWEIRINTDDNTCYFHFETLKDDCEIGNKGNNEKEKMAYVLRI